jgi:acyl carrier protein
MDCKTTIRQYLTELLIRKGDRRPFDDDTSLLLGGRLDSIDTVEIILFLEKEFHIEIARDGFQRTQLDTVNMIEAFVRTSSRALAD